MAPLQQATFTLVPTVPSMQALVSRPADEGAETKPRMTTKQAKKLYREANRQPGLSKAEERRLGRQEQERIRKESEKEKAAKKAKMLRDKKKAREKEAKEERRRKGLPLLDVHPSQDTLAKFFRGKWAGQKRGNPDEDSKTGDQDHSENENQSPQPIPSSPHQPSQKKRRFGHVVELSQGNQTSVAGHLTEQGPSPQQELDKLERILDVLGSSPDLNQTPPKVDPPPSTQPVLTPPADQPETVEGLLPSSTQQFMAEHADELFPSASQLARELEQEGGDDTSFPPVSTQDLAFSSQDFRDLELDTETRHQSPATGLKRPSITENAANPATPAAITPASLLKKRKHLSPFASSTGVSSGRQSPRSAPSLQLASNTSSPTVGTLKFPTPTQNMSAYSGSPRSVAGDMVSVILNMEGEDSIDGVSFTQFFSSSPLLSQKEVVEEELPSGSTKPDSVAQNIEPDVAFAAKRKRFFGSSGNGFKILEAEMERQRLIEEAEKRQIQEMIDERYHREEEYLAQRRLEIEREKQAAAGGHAAHLSPANQPGRIPDDNGQTIQSDRIPSHDVDYLAELDDDNFSTLISLDV